MAQLRIPLAGMMAGVVIIAVDAGIIRSLIASTRVIAITPTTNFDLAGFALGVLPLASVLLFTGVLRLSALLRKGGGGSYFFGFQVFGWVAVFLFILISALSPTLVVDYLGFISTGFVPFLRPLIQTAPEWFLAAFEFCWIAMIFSLPEFAFALLGGWLVRRAGIKVYVERQLKSEVQTAHEEPVEGSIQEGIIPPAAIGNRLSTM